ncbi:hypothetical protein GGX14DRAFT_702110 [Mycena pura]|uniref:Uncharacterized protein n=1 Tax=Mycena pura TaxID=153505 RepID=A0AAD6UP72_9AGAR|nr:hypothetical protein GGX14DRAFT_702110 [Mycena pura]
MSHFKLAFKPWCPALTMTYLEQAFSMYFKLVKSPPAHLAFSARRRLRLTRHARELAARAEVVGGAVLELTALTALCNDAGFEEALEVRKTCALVLDTPRGRCLPSPCACLRECIPGAPALLLLYARSHERAQAHFQRPVPTPTSTTPCTLARIFSTPAAAAALQHPTPRLALPAHVQWRGLVVDAGHGRRRIPSSHARTLNGVCARAHLRRPAPLPPFTARMARPRCCTAILHHLRMLP